MSNMWKKVFVLLSGYLSIIAFAVLGGLVWYKNDEDEDVKRVVKLTLIVTLIFTGISAILGLYNYIGSLWNYYYSSPAYEAYSIMSSLVSIAKIIVFAVLIIKELVKGRDNEEVVTVKKNNYKETTPNKTNNESSSNRKIDTNDDELDEIE